jgi:adenylate kinase family enzyme
MTTRRSDGVARLVLVGYRTRRRRPPARRGRDDDREEVIRNRQRLYRAATLPLLSYYGVKVRTVDAVGSVDDVAERRVQALRSS